MYPIPANATRIRYLESTGTQYIDTGVTAAQNTVSMAVDFTLPNWAVTAISTLAGRRKSTSNPQNAACLFVTGSSYSAGTATSGAIRFDYGSNSVNTQVQNWSSSFATRASAVLSGAVLTVAGGTYTAKLASGSVPAITAPIALFGVANEGSVSTLGSVRIFASQISVGGVLVRSFVPVRVGQVGYLFDRVSGQLFGNAGTGDFVLGPDTFSQGVVPTRMMPMGVRKRPYGAREG